MRLEKRIDDARSDLDDGRYLASARESSAVIEFAFREIFRRCISVVDSSTRHKVSEIETKIGGPGKDISQFSLGETVQLFRESKLFKAYSEATNVQLRGLSLIDLDAVVRLRNQMIHHYYEPNRSEAQLLLHCVEVLLEAFGILTLEAAAEVSPDGLKKEYVARKEDLTQEGEKKASEGSTYSAGVEGEKERLRLQAEFNLALDTKMFDYALSGLPENPVALDLGCAQGYLTYERFTQFGPFSSVIGVDLDASQIGSAIETLPEGWSFEVASIEDPEFQDTLKTLLLDAGSPDKPVLVFLAYVLLHLKSPIKALRSLRSALPAGSKVVIRTTDDGVKLEYHPDRDGRLESVMKPSVPETSGGDREHGRKLFSQLYRAGFREVRMFFEPSIVPNMSTNERETMFSIYFAWRAEGLELKKLKEGLSADEESEYEELKDTLAELELDMGDPSYFLLAGVFGAVATVP